jgi:hypothetical protein
MSEACTVYGTSITRFDGYKYKLLCHLNTPPAPFLENRVYGCSLVTFPYPKGIF